MSEFPFNNVIINVAEAAIVSAIQNSIAPYEVPVIASDENEIKPPMPYITVHVGSYQEEIGPGSGIFRLEVNIVYRSHVKPDDAELRTAICTGINDFLYGAPAVTLSLFDGLHVYGFIPVASGSMAINPELKAYEYQVRADVVCMPRNN